VRKKLLDKVIVGVAALSLVSFTGLAAAEQLIALGEDFPPQECPTSCHEDTKKNCGRAKITCCTDTIPRECECVLICDGSGSENE